MSRMAMERARRGLPSEEERAEAAGGDAALKGVPYGDNPHPPMQKVLRAAWSRGHNGTRARLMLDRERLGLPHPKAADR